VTVDEREHLAEQFEQARPHLLAVAYRMLGSAAEAEDAVQEAWLRLAGSDSAAIENLRAWLTTVVGRVCLDLLRSPRAGHEQLAPFGRPAIANGDPGVVVSRGGRAVAAVRFTIDDGRISAIEVFADPGRLRGLDPVRRSN
jgi:DNA-directed RNA polymerase specialized sigma24 family protein